MRIKIETYILRSEIMRKDAYNFEARPSSYLKQNNRENTITFKHKIIAF